MSIRLARKHLLGRTRRLAEAAEQILPRFAGGDDNRLSESSYSTVFFAFGIIEYLLERRAMSRTLACLFAIFAIGFVAMSYELIEWLYAAYGSNAAAGANFLGSQGDIWDAQKDMLMDTLGALTAVVLFLALRPSPPSRSPGAVA